MQDKTRVKPSIQRPLQAASRSKAGGNRAEALSIIRRAEERQAAEGNRPSRNTNRSNLPKIGTSKKATGLSIDDLPKVYQTIVRKQPIKKKAMYTECAIVLENVIRKITGEEELKAPPADEGGETVSSQASNPV